MIARRRPVVAATVVAVSVVLVAVTDTFVAAPVPTSPAVDVLPSEDAVSGDVVCAVGDGREGTSTSVDLVRPGSPGDPPGVADVRRIGGQDPGTVGDVRLFPGAGARLELDGDEAAAGTASWAGGPIATARSWRIDGDDDLPPGTAAGPCAPTTAATTWTVPGLITSGGHQASLRLANPHPTGATVAIGFLTPDGSQNPTRLRNVSVAAGETLEVDLNEFLPEEDDLAAIVEVASGRVAVEGVQLTRNAIGGVDGVSLLQASTTPTEIATVPWVVAGDDRTSWLWIANATDRTAPVELTVHTEDGGVVASGLAEVEVPPGTVRRVDLRGTLGDGVESAAVTARSEGVPVTVSGVVRLAGDEVDDTGFAVQLGAASDDPVWTIAGGPTEERTEQLRLVNPGSEPAVVDVALWNGTTASQPDELTEIEVPPGALVALPLAAVLGDVPSWAATVRATTGTVVVGQVGSGDPSGPRHLVAGAGVPSAWWRTSGDAPAVRDAPGTTQRLGTGLGIRPEDPLAPDDEVDAPEPAAPSEPGADEPEGATDAG